MSLLLNQTGIVLPCRISPPQSCFSQLLNSPLLCLQRFCVCFTLCVRNKQLNHIDSIFAKLLKVTYNPELNMAYLQLSVCTDDQNFCLFLVCTFFFFSVQAREKMLWILLPILPTEKKIVVPFSARLCRFFKWSFGCFRGDLKGMCRLRWINRWKCLLPLLRI